MHRCRTLRTTATLAFAGLCSACTVVGHVPTDDWPRLSVTENKVDVATMMEHCSRYTSILTWPPMACSEFDLNARTCHIWYVWDVHLEHERLHCAGFDHVGGNTMRQAVAALRAAQVAAGPGVNPASGTGASSGAGRTSSSMQSPMQSPARSPAQSPAQAMPAPAPH